ncbi:hypothetical protein L0Y59_02335 [Candidatus Uhrbacteria bacterium]|nr:hypothetical protein [Candidatus Uhrbacteria bacterium]
MPETHVIGRIENGRCPRPQRQLPPMAQRVVLATDEELEAQGFLLSAPRPRPQAPVATSEGAVIMPPDTEPLPMLALLTDLDLSREEEVAEWREQRRIVTDVHIRANRGNARRIGIRNYGRQPRHDADRRETIRPIAA